MLLRNPYVSLFPANFVTVTSSRENTSQYSLKSAVVDFFFVVVVTQLALQPQQERAQVVCSNKEAQQRLAQRLSHGPWTHKCCFVSF